MTYSKKDLRNFELIWAFIFFIIAFYPLIHSEEIRIWALITSIIFILISLVIPLALSRFYTLWVRFGEFTGKLISKIILLLLFYTLFTSVALILKVLGKDLLHKRLDSNTSSYWKDREQQPGSLKNQF